MYIYGFEKLEVWREAKDLTLIIYRIIMKFPKSEQYGLTTQLRRASISICSNLAEGSIYKSPNQKAHYSTIAFASAVETINHLILALELNYIGQSSYSNLRTRLEKITNKISALKAYQLGKHPKSN